jgi:hypothetical protein
MAALANDGWERFANEYLVDLNATKAYIRAGYGRRGAGQSAHNLLNNTEVQKRIDELRAERAQRTQVKQDDVLHALLPLVFSGLKKLFDVTPEGTPHRGTLRAEAPGFHVLDAVLQAGLALAKPAPRNAHLDNDHALNAAAGPQRALSPVP